MRKLGGLVAVLVFAFVFGPSLVGHMRNAMDPLVFNDDVRQQIFPFFKYIDGGPTSKDVAGDYQLDLMPVGFKLLYRTLMPVIDPEPLSKALPYACLLAMLIGLGMAGWRLGGPLVACATLALALQTPVFLERIMGGMPRGFAFPLIALGLWALTAGKARALAVLVVIGQAFYFVTAAVLCLMLGALLFLVPRSDRGEASEWSVRRRVSVIALVCALSGALAVPVELVMRPWGRLLGPGQAGDYPEAGPGGRYDPADMAPLDRRPSVHAVFTEIRQQAGRALRGGGPPLIASVRNAARGQEVVIADALLVLVALGLVPLAMRHPGARRGLALGFAGIGGFVLAQVFSPFLYVPQRYLVYTLPLFIVAFLPASGAAIAQAVSPRRWAPGARAAGATLATGVALLCLGGRGDPTTGYTVTLDPAVHIYEFLGGLPKDALVAGWPGGPIDNVPYVSRRRAFVTRENHLAFHERYVVEMRLRMRSLIRAYYDTDAQGLKDLRERFGVTHLIVDAKDLSMPPTYFAPFDRDVTRLWQEARGRPFASQAAIGKATVFHEGTLTVLDLSKL